MGMIPSGLVGTSAAGGYGSDQDMMNLGLASKHKKDTVQVPLYGGGKFRPIFPSVSVTTSHRYTTEELGAKMARMRIYNPKKYDERMKYVDSEIRRRYVPAGGGKKDHHDAQDNGAFIREAYNKAFKSKTYTDAMKAYELRMQQPDRYIPAGYKSLENIDLLKERGGELQRRGIFGRRRSQSLVGVEGQ